VGSDRLAVRIDIGSRCAWKKWNGRFGPLKGLINRWKTCSKISLQAPNLLSIPGIGALSAAVFLGELGNPAHFHNGRQIVKYAGYDPQESDSGSWVGRRFISKKGRWLMRKYLFFMSMRVVVLTNYFKTYYERKLETKNRVGELPRRKEILCAVAIKLIKVIFALLRDKRRFVDTCGILTPRS